MEVWDLLCTSVNQEINDMLHNFHKIDKQALLKGLSYYYFKHKESFDSLKILLENIAIFNKIKDLAIEYYDS